MKERGCGGITRKGTNLRRGPLNSPSREALALVATMRVAGLDGYGPPLGVSIVRIHLGTQVLDSLGLQSLDGL